MRRLFVPVCLSVLAFALVNVMFLSPAESAKRWLEEDLFVWDFKWNRPVPPAEIVVLGDSQAMSGVLPRVFRDHGLRIINLGLPSQQPEGILPLIERLPKETRTAVINVSPYFLFKSEVVQSFYSYYRATAPLSLADLRVDAKLAGQNTGDAVYRAVRFLPVLRFRDRLSPLLVQADPFLERNRRTARTALIEKTLEAEGGFWVWKALDPYDCGGTVSPPVQGFVMYKDRPGAEQALRRAAAALIARRIRPVLVYIPFSEAWASLTEPGINERVHGVMRRIAADTGVSIVETPDRRQYAGLFHDWTHLNYCGAQKYSAWLYERLREDTRNEYR